MSLFGVLVSVITTLAFSLFSIYDDQKAIEAFYLCFYSLQSHLSHPDFMFFIYLSHLHPYFPQVGRCFEGAYK